MQNTFDSIALSELNDSGSGLCPSIQVEHALSDIQDTFQTSAFAKIPLAEIATLGGSFASAVSTLTSPAAEGVYRCVFPKGVKGTLAMAKDGTGALGTIVNESGIAAQARWLPVETAVGPACVETALIAVAVLAVVKQIKDIKDSQREIIGILERDKKSQLLADYELLSSYMDDYKFYWENDASVVVNLNQVKNIRRNAMKGVRSYVEQLEGIIKEKKSLIKLKTASQQIGQLLDRFVHYKLALNVFVFSAYMEVMLSKNFQAEYLDRISSEIKDCAYRYKELYTVCYNKIENFVIEAVSTQAVDHVAQTSKTIGNFIGKIPFIKDGKIDEFFVNTGELINERNVKQLEKTLAFFIQYNDSGIIPVAAHIEMVNQLANRPIVMLFDKEVVYFQKLQEAVS